AFLGEAPRFPIRKGLNGHWMAQSSDGRLLAVPWGKDVLLFDARTGALRRALTGHTNQVARAAFSPDGKRLAAGSANAIVRVWAVETGREELVLVGHESWIWCVAFDREGKRLVISEERGSVKVWDAQGRLVTNLDGHTKGVAYVAFSPDGKRLATA